MSTLLEVRGVTHAFAEKPVLRGVDLTIPAGRLLVVVGPNGAGKTTLLRILAGVLAPHAGTLSLAERPLAQLSRREVARRIAVVPQELATPFGFRVREMVAMGRAPYLGVFGREGARDQEVTEQALEALGLTPFADRLYPTLSGGEKQRVLLARALAQTTDLLLLDEPTSHMDLGHRLHTFEWLRAWLAEAASQRGALWVTHDLLLGARFADEVVLLADGAVVARGAPGDVLTPERIAEVYGVEARVTHDDAGRLVITADRSRFGARFGYLPRPS